MNEIDYYCRGLQGYLQGYKRGFYNQMSYEIQPQCFGEESQLLMYKVYDISYSLDIARLFEMPTLLFNLYYMIDVEC